MRQLNKLKVAITARIILLIIIAIVALVLKLNNNTYFSKEASIDTVINNANENIPIKNENNSGNTISLTEIEQYREYSEFKSSTFKPGNVEYHNNGQVKQLSFEFKN